MYLNYYKWTTRRNIWNEKEKGNIELWGTNNLKYTNSRKGTIEKYRRTGKRHMK